MSSGESFLRGLVTPTLAAVTTFALALVADKMAATNDIIASVKDYFPYISATIMFFSLVPTITKRFKDASTPVFDKIDGASDSVTSAVADLGPRVDAIIDGLQAKTQRVLDPIRPLLTKAKAQTAPLKKLSPDLSIPDDKDVDREFDEAQGIVDSKVKEALANLNLDNYVPGYLRSWGGLYCRVVIPTLFCVLLFQLGVAYGSNHFVGSLQSTAPTRRHLRGNASMRMEYAGDYAAAVDLQSIEDQMGEKFEGAKETVTADAEGFEEEFGKDFEATKEVIGTETEQAKEAVSSGAEKAKEAFSSGVETAKEATQEGLVEAKEELQLLEQQAEVYEAELSETVMESLDMVTSTVISYVLAIIQAALAYFFSGARVKSWVVNKTMSTLSDKATDTLRSCGVTTAMEDVLSTRMGRVRKKVIKILSISSKLEDLLGQISGLTALPGSPVKLVESAAEEAKKKGGFLGRLFGKR